MWSSVCAASGELLDLGVDVDGHPLAAQRYAVDRGLDELPQQVAVHLEHGVPIGRADLYQRHLPFAHVGGTDSDIPDAGWRGQSSDHQVAGEDPIHETIATGLDLDGHRIEVLTNAA